MLAKIHWWVVTVLGLTLVDELYFYFAMTNQRGQKLYNRRTVFTTTMTNQTVKVID